MIIKVSVFRTFCCVVARIALATDCKVSVVVVVAGQSVQHLDVNADGMPSETSKKRAKRCI